MNRGISVALLAVLFYGTLLLAAVFLSRSRIEGDLTQRAVDALEGVKNLSSALDLRVNGRDVVIEGEVHGKGQSQRALVALHALEGVRVVENRLSVKPLEDSRKY